MFDALPHTEAGHVARLLLKELVACHTDDALALMAVVNVHLREQRTKEVDRLAHSAYLTAEHEYPVL